MSARSRHHPWWREEGCDLLAKAISDYLSGETRVSPELERLVEEDERLRFERLRSKDVVFCGPLSSMDPWLAFAELLRRHPLIP